MIASPKFLSHGQMRKSCCCCNVFRAWDWYERRFVFPIRFLNSLFSCFEKFSRRLSRTTGGHVQCGGVQLEQTYIFGSYGSSEDSVEPAKWNRRWMARPNLVIVVSFSLFQMFVRVGVGINFRPRSNNDRRFLAGCFCCVKS